MAKILIKYKNGETPENLGDLLSNADEQDLRILVALMMSANGEGQVPEELSLTDMLGLEKPEIDASLKFWRGAGVIGTSRGSKNAKSAEVHQSEKSGAKIATAHRNGAVEKSAGGYSYTTDELNTIFEKRKVTLEFLHEAQQVFGKMFNNYETGIIVGLIDQYGFEEEAVLHILSYVAGRDGRKGVRYCEKIALSFYDDGITTAKDVSQRITLIEQSAEKAGRIKQLFGIGSRELSKTEKTLFDKWTQKFGYEVEVIRIAYDMTVDAIQKPVPKYADAILQKWYEAGLRTEDEIKNFVETEKQKKDGGESDKSYDLDDFFEAALKRSFEDLN